MKTARFAIITFQTDRKNNLLRLSGKLDHCNLKNIKVYLISEVYPYKYFRVDFENNVSFILYKMYADYQTSYYDKNQR